VSRALAYGIDFGTTNSSIAVAYDDGVEVVSIDGSPVMPSIISLDATGNRLAGDRAVQQFLAGAGEGRLMSSLKSFLTDAGTTTDVYGTEYDIAHLVAIVLGALKHAADEVTGEKVTRLVLGHPVLFVGADGDDFEVKQERAIGCLEKAAHVAGFKEVAFLDEPTAALLGEELDDGHLLSVDFGGGTFDVSVVRVTPTDGEVLSIHGAAVGGELFDSLLFDDKLAGPLGLDDDYAVGPKTLPVPWSIKRMRTLGDCLQMVADQRTWTALQNIRQWPGGSVFKTVEAILAGGHGYSFFWSIEKAKIDVSSQTKSAITFSRPGIAIKEPLARSEFERLIERNLDVVDDQIGKALNDANVDPEDIDLVVRTGGSSRIPAFVDRLADRFGAEKLAERDAFTAVAEGLALRAMQTFGDT
jgi:hypothetical chaperone protein